MGAVASVPLRVPTNLRSPWAPCEQFGPCAWLGVPALLPLRLHSPPSPVCLGCPQCPAGASSSHRQLARTAPQTGTTAPVKH